MANGLGSILGRSLAGGQQIQRSALQDIALQQAEQAQGLRRAALGQEAPEAQPLSLAPVSPGAAMVPQDINPEQALAQLAIADPASFEAVSKSIGLDTQTKKDEAADFAFKLQGTPFEQRESVIQERVVKLRSEGRDPKDTEQLSGLPQDQQDQTLKVVQIAALSPKERADLASGKGLSAEQRAFETLIGEFTPEEQEKARRVKAGLSPRAVGSAAQTITTLDIAEDVGETTAIIEQRKEFGKKTGASRANAIDKGFERIVKIDQGILNLDRAIAALDAGAKTGAIQRFAPSIRASSVALDQIKNELALDVLNSATFGALSEKELELTKETALPTKLSPPELRVWLGDKKVAQQKLKDYFQEQIDFLDQGGTVAGFLRMKRRNTEGGTQETTEVAVEEAPQQILQFNPATGRLE